MDDKLENFERAFSESTGGCLRTCACGVVYFDDHNDYGWEDGELEKLRANPANVALDYAPSDISFGGSEYVDGCNCWHARAKQIMKFLDGHAQGVAMYLNLEKKRLQAIADAAPTVGLNRD